LKRGVDAKTLVEDNELFKFEKDVMPILAVLCGKTLEQARMEVLEEEELRVMRTQQSHFSDLSKTEHGDATRMEQMEARKLQEFERRKALERERKKNKIAAHRKICSRFIAKGYMNHLRDSTVTYLSDVGYFTDTFKVEVLEQNVLPWLFTHVEGFVEELDQLGEFSDVFLSSNLDECLTLHEQTVKQEKDRKEGARRAIQEAQRDKLEDKRRKKEAKEASRKAAELKRLKEDVHSVYIAKGDYRDSILSNEVTNANGFHSRNPCAGVLGGFLGQLILVISGAHKKVKEAGLEKLMLDPKIV
jgi:radial spoke head protein 3